MHKNLKITTPRKTNIMLWKSTKHLKDFIIYTLEIFNVETFLNYS